MNISQKDPFPEPALKPAGDQDSGAGKSGSELFRTRFLVAVALILIVAAGLLALVPRWKYAADLEASDRRAMERAVDTVRVAIGNEIEALSRTSVDWAVWDATYNYARGQYPEYLEVNTSNPESSMESGIDLIAIYDPRGDLLAFELMDKSQEIGPEELEPLRQAVAGTRAEGLFMVGELPLIAASHPIYPTSGEGEPAGMLVMARFLDQELIQQIQDNYHLEVEVAGVAEDMASTLEPSQADEMQAAGLFLGETGDELDQLYFTMESLDGERIVMSFPWSRAIIADGRRLANYALLLFVMAVLLIAGGITLLFFRYSAVMRRGKEELARELEERSLELAERERRHRFIVDNSPIGIAHIDSSGQVIDANPALHHIMGRPVGSYLGVKLHEEYKGRKFEEMINTAGLGVSISTDWQFSRETDGRQVYVNMILHPMESEERPTDILCMISDITERKLDEEKLHQLRSAVESSPVTVLIINRCGIIEYVNRYYVEMSGYSVEETLGRSQDIMGERTESRLAYESMVETVMDGRTWQGDLRNRRKNGERYWEKAIVAPIVRADGELTHFVAITEDITERKQLAEVDQFLARLETMPLEVEGWQIWQETLAQALEWTDSPVGWAVARYGREKVAMCMRREGGATRVEEMASEEARKMLAGFEQAFRSAGEQPVVVLNQVSDGDISGLPPGEMPLHRQLRLIQNAGRRGRGVIILANKEFPYSEAEERVAGRLADGLRSVLARRRVEKRLRASQKRLAAVLESVNTGITVIDSSNRQIAYVNQAALDMIGAPESEVLGRVCHEFLCPASQNSCPIMDLNQASDQSERVMLKADGSRLPVLKTVVPLQFGDKRFLLESFMDLSESKAIERELAAAREKAEVASRTKSLFLANMSHEIRTPMNAILGYSQLMMRDPHLNSRQLSNLEVISRSGEHLLQLINEILEMSRIESGQLELRATPCNFPRLLGDVASMFGLIASQKGLTLDFKVSDLLPPVLMIDESKVRQILVNLMGNATKFTEKGGYVKVRCEMMPADLLSQELVNVRIEVEDSGFGISPAERDRIFESFSQGEGGQLKGGGTGLGLAISREFARVIGGELYLKHSAPGQGSCFVFTFSSLMADSAGVSSRARKERRVISIADPSREWRALVVDDHSANRGFLADLLKDVGFTVKEAADGREGLEAVREWQPDIVLMDLMMPNMDGHEAIKAIRGLGKGQDTPILAVSASVMRGDGKKALRSGANGFLRKPYLDSDLLEAIRQLIGIEYRYAPPGPSGSDADEAGKSTERSRREIGRAGISRLAPETIEALKCAVIEGDMAALSDLIDRLPASESQLAGILRDMADHFDYENLLEVLDGEEE